MIQHKKRKDDGSYFYSHLLCLPREKVGLQCLCTKVTLKIRFIHTTAIKPVCYVSSETSMLDKMHAKTCFRTRLFAMTSHDNAEKEENFASYGASKLLQNLI